MGSIRAFCGPGYHENMVVQPWVREITRSDRDGVMLVGRQGASD